MTSLSRPEPARFLASPARFLAHYVAARPVAYATLTALVLGRAASNVLVQYAMKLLIDAMTAPTHSMAHIHFGLFVFLFFVGLECLLLRLSTWMLSALTVSTGVRIRLDMFGYLSCHQLSFFQNQRAGSLGQRVAALAGTFGALVHRLLAEVTPPLVAFAGAIIIFFSIDVTMAAVLAAVFVVASAALVVLGLRGDALHKAFARQSGESSGELVDVIGNIWSVKAFAARPRETERLRGYFRAEAKAQKRAWTFVERIRGLHDVALVVMVGGALWWALARWQAGAITVGDVTIVSAMTFRMLQGSRDMAMALIDTGQQFSYLGETLDTIGVPHSLMDRAGAKRLHVRNGSVRFDRVTFGYDPHRPVLHDLSLEVPAGQKVGIVGSSGAGKSTILQLVQRLHDTGSGAVLINEQPVDQVTQDSLHEALAVVPQEVLLFHRSIMENIRFGRPDATDAEVLAAADAARCTDFIAGLPSGYDTIVGERGTNLSGGQRQRIGIARAFLKDARIVLLDEATSALDTDSELAVQQGLDALMSGRTVLAVAHRLSTVVTFDRILVVEDGRVVEDGPPLDLLRQEDGAFKRLWAMQAEALDVERPTVEQGGVLGGAGEWIAERVPEWMKAPRWPGTWWKEAEREAAE